MSNKESKSTTFISTKGYIQQIIFYIIGLLSFLVLLLIAHKRQTEPGMIFAGVLMLIIVFPLVSDICNVIEYTHKAKKQTTFIGKISNWKRYGLYGYALMLEHEGVDYDSGPFMNNKRPEKFVGKQVEYCIIGNKLFILRFTEDEAV